MASITHRHTCTESNEIVAIANVTNDHVHNVRRVDNERRDARDAYNERRDARYFTAVFPTAKLLTALF